MTYPSPPLRPVQRAPGYGRLCAALCVPVSDRSRPAPMAPPGHALASAGTSVPITTAPLPARVSRLLPGASSQHHCHSRQPPLPPPTSRHPGQPLSVLPRLHLPAIPPPSSRPRLPHRSSRPPPAQSPSPPSSFPRKRESTSPRRNGGTTGGRRTSSYLLTITKHHRQPPPRVHSPSLSLRDGEGAGG